MSDRYCILIVDDSPDTIEVIKRNLADNGYHVLSALDVSSAMDILDGEKVDLVITDMKMPKVSGLDLVRHVRENFPDMEVMMITGYATVEGAVEAVKCGAEEYLTKPFTDEELLSAVRRSLGALSLRRSQSETPKSDFSKSGLVGESASIRKVFSEIEKAAMTPATVLITGESGTGKELVARSVHYRSKRATAAFLPVNCGGIPEGLLESELFGHVKGAFTGASESRAGFFQTADGGTIFLDEISETSLGMQVKLLRVLQDREVCMVGDTRTRKVDVRIMAATNKSLGNLVKKKMFREDLFFRLNVINIDVPPLRDRGDDTLLLIKHFATKFSKEYGIESPAFSTSTLRALKNYSWPGNVRELENLVQRVMVMNDGGPIELPDLPAPMRFSASRHSGANKTLAEVEAEHIRLVLSGVGGNKSKAATILGIDRKTLREKMKRMDEET
jgi:two-component system, NtrC family, response regulator HydG